MLTGMLDLTECLVGFQAYYIAIFKFVFECTTDALIPRQKGC